jgi:predicted alpha/beta-fold hydrolase
VTTAPSLRERLGGHLWTVLPTARDLVLPPALSGEQEHEIEVVDDCFGPTTLRCSLSVPPSARSVVVLVHGLGGSRRSGYVMRAAAELHRRRFATARLDLRGADRRGGGFYHVALTEDLDAVCRAPALRPFDRIFVLGFSMGGHVAMHFAAKGSDARLSGVAAICSPLDLHAAQRHLDAPARVCYRRYVLRGLIDIYEAVGRRHPVPTPVELVRRCRTFHDWDRLTIARRYGYESPEAFYAAQSARRVLPELRVETLLVLAQNDPIVPPELVVPHLSEAAPGKLLVSVLARGGHMRFPRSGDLGLGLARGGGVTGQLAEHWAGAAR